MNNALTRVFDVFTTISLITTFLLFDTFNIMRSVYFHSNITSQNIANAHKTFCSEKILCNKLIGINTPWNMFFDI